MSVFGAIKIVRPLNGLISSATVWVSFLIAGGHYGDSTGILVAIAAFSFAGFANTVNDIVDIEIDRINRPWRPLPSNKITKRMAAGESFLLGIAALAISAFLGPANLAIGLVAILGMTVYNFWLKPTPFWGNLLVSFVAALAFLYGGAAHGNFLPVILPAAMAFLLHLGREIVKDIEDIEGDSRLGARTLPIVKGVRFARVLTAGILTVLTSVTIAPYVAGYYGLGYLAIVSIVDIILLYITFKLLFGSVLKAGFLSQLLKLSMPLGIGAVFLGSLSM